MVDRLCQSCQVAPATVTTFKTLRGGRKHVSVRCAPCATGTNKPSIAVSKHKSQKENQK